MANLAWRAEAACFNAWPSLRQVRFGDWIARGGAGFTRRINSANPLRRRAGGLEQDLEAIEATYRRWGTLPRFRIPSMIDPGADRRLEHLNYEAEAETLTLYADCADLATGDDRDVDVSPVLTRAWMEAKRVLSGLSPEQDRTYDAVLSQIAVPAGFARLRTDQILTAVAFGALHDRLLCVEGVVTEGRQRGKGFGRRLLSALVSWGVAAGAEGVCLQVEAGNGAGLGLYRSLGITRELYRYHYRRAPEA